VAVGRAIPLLVMVELVYKTNRRLKRMAQYQITVDGEVLHQLFRGDEGMAKLLLAMMEMVINGVSTRKVRRITEELCGTSFSKSTVSEWCKALDPIVREWNERSLEAVAYPFVIVDALQLKIRKGGCVIPQSAVLAVGVNAEGYREVLGLMIGDSESEASWSEFFTWLKQRGLTGVDLVVSDHHGGLVNAIRRRFQGASWQRCQVHLMRNVLDAAPAHCQHSL